MRRVFADSSFYVALLVPDDAWHRLAVSYSNSYTGNYVTTDYILLELGAFLPRGTLRPMFVDLAERLAASQTTEIVPASADLLKKGLKLFASRPDKDSSLTDCTSFAVMERLGITDALSADRHFEQAGFQSVLRITENN